MGNKENDYGMKLAKAVANLEQIILDGHRDEINSYFENQFEDYLKKLKANFHLSKKALDIQKKTKELIIFLILQRVNNFTWTLNRV